MKKVSGKIFAKGMASVLCASVIMGTVGCGGVQNAGGMQASDEVQAGGSAVADDFQNVNGGETGTSKAGAQDFAKISDNGKPITDFYEFINGEWMDQKKSGGKSATYWWDEGTLVIEKYRDILDNADISKMSEDDGLYKTISVYRHFLDTSDYEKRIESAKRHLEPIENIKSLEDIYQLYRNEEYMTYSGAFKFTIEPDYNGYNAVWFRPDSLMENVNLQKSWISDKSSSGGAGEALLSVMENLGYSEERTLQMLDNAAKVGQMIDDFYSEPVEVSIGYFAQKDLDKENVTFPVIEILKEQNLLGKNKNFIAKTNCCSLFNKLYQKENVTAIKDHMLLGAISKLMPVFGEDVIKNSYGSEYNEVAYTFITTYAPDALNDEFYIRNLGDYDEQRAQEIVEDIKNGYREIINDAEWLSVHGKELAKHKILTMRVCFGKNEAENDLSDVELTGDLVDDYVSIIISRMRFAKSQIKKEDDKRPIYNADLFNVNARFLYEYNALYVTGGLLASPYCSKDAAFEEMLGYYGATVAHEYGHSYDPRGINYEWHGWWETWMKEDEEAAYLEDQQAIEDFFNGLETDYGRKIDGKQVKNETYADLMAIKCCLKILEKRENPDYDLFFRTFATKNASYVAEQDIDNAMTDDHLPGRLRVNLILGQFDKFYEIYDIDESSPYYIPVDKRLEVF